jgi:hypothetical protein
LLGYEIYISPIANNRVPSQDCPKPLTKTELENILGKPLEKEKRYRARVSSDNVFWEKVEVTANTLLEAIQILKKENPDKIITRPRPII